MPHPIGCTPENRIKLQVDHTRWTPFIDNTHRYGYRTGTSMEATAAPNDSVCRSSLQPRHRRSLLLPRLERGSRRFVPVSPRLRLLVLPLWPCLKPRRRVTVPVKRRKLWQQRPTLQPQGLRSRQQLPNLQFLRLPQVARGCCR